MCNKAKTGRQRRRVAWFVGSLVVAALAGGPLAGCGGPSTPALTLAGTMSSATYCHDGGISETLDVYEPGRAVPSAPVVVYIHGGGWVSGDSHLQPGSVEADVESDLLAKGWVFISINYRLAPSSPWPAPIEDAKCAIRFVRAHADSYRIDPERIAVMGASAGGQLASLVGLTGNQPLFVQGDYLDESSAVSAVVDEYGPADLTSPDWADSKVVPELSEKTFGERVGHVSATLIAASPVTYVHPGAPPFFVVQGREDDLVPATQSEELVERLRQAGDQATLLMVEHANHGLVPAGGGPVTPGITVVASDIVSFLTTQVTPAH